MEYFKERKRLKQFKKDIKGIFNEWRSDRHHLENGRYKLWRASGLGHFRDEGRECFLTCFTKAERELLWKESLNRQTSKGREKIFKEFNLTNDKE